VEANFKLSSFVFGTIERVVSPVVGFGDIII